MGDRLDAYREIDEVMRFDVPAYCRAVVRIKDKDSGQRIPLRLKRAQLAVHEALEAQRKATGKVRALILKYRQGGISTYVAARYYHATSLNMGTKTYILTHEDKGTVNLFGMAKAIHEHMALDYRPRDTAKNANELWFGGLDSGYAVGTAQSNSGTGRSSTIHRFHGSECCFWRNAEEHFAGVLQAVPMAAGTEIIMESTANGPSGAFYNQWLLAQRGESQFIAIFLPWYWEDAYRMSRPEGLQFSEGEDGELEYAETYGLDTEQLTWAHYKNIELGGEPGKFGWYFRQEYPACISGNARVSTQRGIVHLREVVAGDICATGLVSNIRATGRKPVVKVTTVLGYQVICTPEHRLGLIDGEWLRADQCIGKAIKLQRPVFAESESVVAWSILPSTIGSITIGESWGRLLGYYMGDGSFYGATLSIACTRADDDVTNDVATLISSLIGTPGIRVTGDKGGCSEVRIQNKELKPLFAAIGISEQSGKTRDTKRVVCVPECIWRSPINVVREFLRALFESDGFAGYETPRVSLFSKHLEFLRDIQILLLGFGITARLSSKPAKNGGGFEYQANTLTLRTAEAQAFVKTIGFVSGRKNARGLSWCDTSKFTLGRNRRDVVLEDAIESVIDFGEEDVFDLTVPESESFDACGLLVHNCSAEAFQTSGSDSFISARSIMAARKVPPPDHDESTIILGCDVARGGDDRTRLIDKQRRCYGRNYNLTWHLDDEMVIADQIAVLMNKDRRIRMVNIDITGVGGGVFTRLKQLGFESRVAGINFGSGAGDPNKYQNKRAEMWGDLKDDLKLPGASIPDDDLLHSHLAAPGYRFDANSRLILEKKEDIKKRCGFSPDGGDAMALCHGSQVIDRANLDDRPKWMQELRAGKAGSGFMSR